MNTPRLGVHVLLLATLAACNAAPQGGDGGGAGSGGADAVEIAATLVDVSGATLSGDSVSLVVPADAVASAVELQVTRLGASSVARLPEPTAAGLVGAAELLDATFAFTPHGTLFARPVAIELRHEGEGNVVLRLDDEADATWELVEGATFEAGVARFAVERFSIYAVAAATRECQRAACAAFPPALACGRIDDGCGGTVDLVTDCGRPACAAGSSCNDAHVCAPDGCVSTFDCATTTAECGVEQDDCGVAHDVLAECPGVPGCGALGSCTDLNLCGACTPFADCTEALAAVGQRCNPAVPDGCGGALACAATTCAAGTECLRVVDEFAEGGGYFSCETPCTLDAECTHLLALGCFDADTMEVGGMWCEAATYCRGNIGHVDCMDDAGTPTACVDGACQ